jgi:hypothetical protein
MVCGQFYTPVVLTPEYEPPDTHYIGVWAGTTIGLDVVDYRKISFLCRESNPGRPARNPSLYRMISNSACDTENKHCAVLVQEIYKNKFKWGVEER